MPQQKAAAHFAVLIVFAGLVTLYVGHSQTAAHAAHSEYKAEGGVLEQLNKHSGRTQQPPEVAPSLKRGIKPPTLVSEAKATKKEKEEEGIAPSEQTSPSLPIVSVDAAVVSSSSSSSSVLTSKIPLVFEDQNKVYWLPNVDATGAVQHKRIMRESGTLIDPEQPDHIIRWHILSTTTPRALYIDNMLSAEECDDIVAAAQKAITRSTVISLQGMGKSTSVEDSVRTSSGMFMTGANAKMSANRNLHRRAELLAGLGQEDWIESTQVLRYRQGQHYLPHIDFFSEQDHSNLDRGGQRIASMVTALNDCKNGGGTSFPSAKVNGTNNKAQLMFKAKKRGDAVLFYDVDDTFNTDWHSQHGGSDPEKGSQKWAAVLWMHPRPFH